MRLDAYDFIEKGPDIVRLYLNDIQAPSLTRKQEAKATPEELVEHNLQLVPLFAKKYRSKPPHRWLHTLSFLDLIQEGNFGLIRASKTFDGKKGFKFSTYASYWIKRSIDRAIRDKGRTIRVPANVWDNPSYTHELNGILDSTMVVSFEDCIDGNGLCLGETHSTPISRSKDKDEFELKAAVKEVLSFLDEDERKFIRMKFGIDDSAYVHTCVARGRKLSKAHNTVGEIERRAMTKLRCPSLSRKLRPFVVACFVFLFSLSVFAQCEQIIGTQVPLYWDANTEPNIDFYNVYRSGTSGSGYGFIGTVMQGIDPIGTTDSNPLQTGYYVVSAVNTSGLESGLSNELCVLFTQSTPGVPPPGIPEMLIFTLPIDASVVAPDGTLLPPMPNDWMEELVNQGF